MLVLVLFALSCLVCSVPVLLCLRPLTPAGCRAHAPLSSGFPTGSGQWEALVLDWRARGRRNHGVFLFSLLWAALPAVVPAPPGYSSSWTGNGCGSSFPLVTLVPTLTTTSFCGRLLPLTLAGWLPFPWVASQLFPPPV